MNKIFAIAAFTIFGSIPCFAAPMNIDCYQMNGQFYLPSAVTIERVQMQIAEDHIPTTAIVQVLIRVGLTGRVTVSAQGPVVQNKDGGWTLITSLSDKNFDRLQIDMDIPAEGSWMIAFADPINKDDPRAKAFGALKCGLKK